MVRMVVERQLILQQLGAAEIALQEATRMLEEGKPCREVLHQLAAVQRALESTCADILWMEIERSFQTVRENPCPDTRCEEVARFATYYSVWNEL